MSAIALEKKSAIFTSIKYRLQREGNGRELLEGADYDGRSLKILITC
ncbi:MAG: hypothetical protein LH649_13985 [Pseudanabaena sp. CAN_BIN31]|nr:hypothetical protein [Pseudanabaena sp. CAN_BIN31]